MIVKDEAHVIKRCLASVLPFIDSWIICDTGSTDGTQKIITEFMKRAGKPGRIFQHEWKDFGTNRTMAIEAARYAADFVFTIDADEELMIDPAFSMPDFSHNSYFMDVVSGDYTFKRECLLKVDEDGPNWRYVGVLHEYLDGGAGPRIVGNLNKIWVVTHSDGGRSKEPPEIKYLRDAKVLEKALQAEPDNERYMFYLAQSFRDTGYFEGAIGWYQERVKKGRWYEEVFWSKLQIAKCMESGDYEAHEVIKAYMDAYEYRPERVETLVELSRYLRGQNMHACAKIWAWQAMQIPKTHDVMFIDQSAYGWRAADEYAVCCYWTGEYEPAIEIWNGLLAGKELPDRESDRVRANINFAISKLSGTREGSSFPVAAVSEHPIPGTVSVPSKAAGRKRSSSARQS